MRVLFLSPAGALGGAERCLLDLAASLRANSGSRDVALGVIAGRDGPLIEEARRVGMQVIRLPLGERLAAVGDSALISEGARSILAFGRRGVHAALDVAAYVRRLSSAIREFSPSVVHSNGIKMHLLAAAAFVDAPLLWHIRDFIGERPLVSRALRACAWRARRAIAISNAVARDANRVLPHLPISVVHDAIDTDVFSPMGAVANLDELAGAPAAPPGTVRVGLVATYARWKGQDVFLRAARHVQAARSRAGIRFYVIGGPIYDTAASQYGQEELAGMARELDVERSVRFIPFQSRIEETYRALDIVVHASTRPEPFGRTIAEAMASGKPLIASRDSGAAELFSEGADALSVRSGSPEDLAAAVLVLAEDRARRERLGAAAHAAAVQHFSRGRLASQVLQVYRDAGAVGFKRGGPNADRPDPG